MLHQSLGEASAGGKNCQGLICVLEPRPTNDLENEDDDEYEDDLRRVPNAKRN
jgi:hypothetical protein